MLKALERMPNKDEHHVLEIVKALVDHGVDVNYGGTGLSALGLAVGNYEIVKFLIESGVDMNSVYTQRALCRAATSGEKEVVSLLIEKGVDIHSTPFTDKRTPFMHASSTRDNRDVVQLFLDSGSKVNAKDRDGFTALMLASLTRDIEMIHLLLDAGADVHAKNSKGETAEMIAQNRKLFDVVKVLQDAGGTRNEKNNNTDHNK